jgi:biopolymer transport protein ExbB/TolQ
MRATCAILTLVVSATAIAQAPVQDLTSREQAIQRSQQNTGAAYRDLQQAGHESKLAEQDFLNAQEAQRMAQQRADEAKRRLEIATKSRDAARMKEAQAKKHYDDSLKGVDRAFEKAPVDKK